MIDQQPPGVREKLKAHVSKGSFDKKTLQQIFLSKDNDELISALVCSYNMTDNDKSSLWYHVIEKVWDDEENDYNFDDYQCILFRAIVRNDGFFKRKDAMNLGIFKKMNQHKVKETARGLEEIGVIDVYVLRNKEVVYVLNRSLYMEVFGDARE